jgi:opacity protein-like surface antigen
MKSFLLTAACLAAISTSAYALDFNGAPYAHRPADISSPGGIGSDYVASPPETDRSGNDRQEFR